MTVRSYLCAVAAVICAGCLGNSGPNALGEACVSDWECDSELCLHGLCTHPLSDPDGDGLANKVEAVAGTDIHNADTDGDGLGDLEELGQNPLNPPDADGDGDNDAIESLWLDSDCDGISDQHDGQDLETGSSSSEPPCSADQDFDGVPDSEDLCPLIFDSVQEDADGDGHGDSCDVCSLGDDDLDADSDTVPDACDVCPGDDRNDLDMDGVPDDCDLCEGQADGEGDEDGDGVPDACDVCPGQSDEGPDGDGDGVPGNCDVCPGYDDHQDQDLDGIPDGCDTSGDGSGEEASGEDAS